MLINFIGFLGLCFGILIIIADRYNAKKKAETGKQSSEHTP